MVCELNKLTSLTSLYILRLERFAMPVTYSTYDAKAKFSEILRKVRRGEIVYITYRGEEVAEIRPVEKKEETLEERIQKLRERGVLVGPVNRDAPIEPIARKPGALKRFLEERD